MERRPKVRRRNRSILAGGAPCLRPLRCRRAAARERPAPPSVPAASHLLPRAAARGSLPPQPRPRPRSGRPRGASAQPAPGASSRAGESAHDRLWGPSRCCRRCALEGAGGRCRLLRSRCPRRRALQGDPAAGCSRAARRPRASRSRAPACSRRARSHLRRARPEEAPAERPLPGRLFLRPQPPPPTWEGCTSSRRRRRHCSTPSSPGAAPGLCCPLPARVPPAAVGALTCVHVGEHTRVSGRAGPPEKSESFPLLGRMKKTRLSLFWENLFLEKRTTRLFVKGKPKHNYTQFPLLQMWSRRPVPCYLIRFYQFKNLSFNLASQWTRSKSEN